MGLADRIRGIQAKKQAAPAPHTDELVTYLITTQQKFLLYLQQYKALFLASDREAIISLSERYARDLQEFRKKKDIYANRGGRHYMLYRVFSEEFAAVYEAVNYYINGKEKDVDKTLRPIVSALFALSQQDVPTALAA